MPGFAGLSAASGFESSPPDLSSVFSAVESLRLLTFTSIVVISFSFTSINSRLLSYSQRKGLFKFTSLINQIRHRTAISCELRNKFLETKPLMEKTNSLRFADVLERSHFVQTRTESSQKLFHTFVCTLS